MPEEIPTQTENETSPLQETTESPTEIPLEELHDYKEAKKIKKIAKTALLFLLGMILGGGLVFGGYQLKQRQVPSGSGSLPTPTENPTPSTPTPTPDPTVDWEVYTSGQGGYLIKYPKGLFVEEKENLVSIYNQDPATYKFERTREISPGLFDYPKENFIFQIEIDRNLSSWPALDEKKIATISGIKGVAGILTARGGEKAIMAYMVEDEKTYSFYVRPTDSDQTNLFDQILSTFKLTVVCQEPRPEVCTMECIANPPYICGSDGKSYCTTCQACSNSEVEWYIIQEDHC